MTYDPKVPYNDLPDLPPKMDIETSELLLNHVIVASRSLAELKGLCETMTEEALLNLLFNTVVMQESRDSSAIENIVTTQDELYQAVLNAENANPAAKEVLSYREAIQSGLHLMRDNQNFITTNILVDIVQRIKQNQSGIRVQPGTVLKNSITGNIIYTPPCCEEEIRQKMASLEKFININELSPLDPIIKLTLIHYQFESIHPFSDGNGRTGRILNMLYLIQQQLLPHPVLYLSAYIIDHKQDYYRLLNEVSQKENWRDWILFMTTAVHETAQLTIQKIRDILQLKKELEPQVFKSLEKFGKRNELFELMFNMPYLKIELLVIKGIAHRETASNYLKILEKDGLLTALKISKSTYYINHRLMELLVRRD
ncbi:MAG: Fic family protein [Bacteroidetes bacterium]|nr:Fic family protein [Bacteroidota bacterium]